MFRFRCVAFCVATLAALDRSTARAAEPSSAAPAEAVVKLADFVVTPSRFGIADAPTAAAATLTAAELEALPQVGDDLFRTIARLPGLQADDVSAQFWVRGAPQSELLARLDGVDLLEPFHLKDADGALSIIDPAIIQRLDLTTGGFTAEFGDRLAGVLTMETKTPARRATVLGLSFTGAGATQQGVFAGHRGRWLASARRGYPDLALKLTDRANDVSPRYYDVFGKIEYEPAPAQTLALHVLHAGDGLRYDRTNQPSLLSSYASDYAWARWRGSVGEAVSGEAVLSFSQLEWNRGGSGRLDGFPFSLRDFRRLKLVALRNDWNATLAPPLVLRGGINASSGDARYDYALLHQRNAVSGAAQVVATQRVNAALHPDGEAFGAFAALRAQPWRALVLEPGVRLDRAHTGQEEISPRFNAALTLGGTTLRAAWSRYAQAHGLHELSVADGETRFRRPERAEHRVLGLERPLGERASLRLEAYERISTRLGPRWENLDNPYDLFPEAEADRVRLDPDRGRARGVELLLSSRGASPWKWNASYVLARAEERVAGRWIPRRRDQRHAFYGDVTWTPNPRWQFSAAWQFHTGWPTTDVVYSLATLANGRRLLVSANGPVYGLRLPDYHRLDLRATRRFALRRGEVRAFLDVFNAYDRRNYLGYDHDVSVAGTQVTDRRKVREQLPILPSIGATWEF